MNAMIIAKYDDATLANATATKIDQNKPTTATSCRVKVFDTIKSTKTSQTMRNSSTGV